jgi:hypothetical protein
MSLIERLLAREFEFNLSTLQLLYYTGERRLSRMLFHRFPPKRGSPNLLN